MRHASPFSGLTQSAAQILDPALRVNPAVNFYFMFVSATLIVVLGTWITERVVEPRLGPYFALIVAFAHGPAPRAGRAAPHATAAVEVAGTTCRHIPVTGPGA